MTEYPAGASIAFVAVAASLLMGISLLIVHVVPSRRAGRVTVAVLAAWFAAMIVAADRNLFFAAGTPPFMVGLPLVASLLGAAVLLRVPGVRAALRSVPQELLVAPHMLRVVGLLFVLLADGGFLPYGFAAPAGYGDLIAAGLALPTIVLLQFGGRRATVALLVFHCAGLLDFLIALGTGPALLPDHFAEFGQPYGLNYGAFLPAFVVPLFVLLHLWSLVVMADQHRAGRTHRQHRDLVRAHQS